MNESLKYFDDAKLKPQSHEGHFDADDSGPDSNWTLSISAYGPNKAHVKTHLCAALDDIIERLRVTRASLIQSNIDDV